LICRNQKLLKLSLFLSEFVPETIYIKDVMNLLTKSEKKCGGGAGEYGGT
jgi:hypothetical protein